MGHRNASPFRQETAQRGLSSRLRSLAEASFVHICRGELLSQFWSDFGLSRCTDRLTCPCSSLGFRKYVFWWCAATIHINPNDLFGCIHACYMGCLTRLASRLTSPCTSTTTTTFWMHSLLSVIVKEIRIIISSYCSRHNLVRL